MRLACFGHQSGQAVSFQCAFLNFSLAAMFSLVGSSFLGGVPPLTLMNADVSQLQGLFLYLVDQALLRSWAHFDWMLTFLQSSQSHKVSSFVDCLP